MCNAGVAGQGRLGDSSIAELDRMWAVNVRGVVLGIQAALPALRATKGAVNLVRAAAFDLGPAGIRVNGVCPGPIEGAGMTLPLGHHRPQMFEAIPTLRGSWRAGIEATSDPSAS